MTHLQVKTSYFLLEMNYCNMEITCFLLEISHCNMETTYFLLEMNHYIIEITYLRLEISHCNVEIEYFLALFKFFYLLFSHYFIQNIFFNKQRALVGCTCKKKDLISFVFSC